MKRFGDADRTLAMFNEWVDELSSRGSETRICLAFSLTQLSHRR